MPRYIDADAIHYVEIGKGVEIALASDIDKIPTVSPDEVRGVGEWVTTRTWEHDGDPYCSKCGFEQSYMRFEKFKFCPSCGARMKGADGSK